MWWLMPAVLICTGLGVSGWVLGRVYALLRGRLLLLALALGLLSICGMTQTSRRRDPVVVAYFCFGWLAFGVAAELAAAQRARGSPGGRPPGGRHS